MARRKTRRTARRSSSRGRGGFALKELLMTGATGAAGVFAVNKVLERVLPADASPYMRIAATAGIALLAGKFLAKFNPTIARGISVGGSVAAGLMAMNELRAGMSGMSGMGILPMQTYNRGIGELMPGEETGMGNYNTMTSEYAPG